MFIKGVPPDDDLAVGRPTSSNGSACRLTGGRRRAGSATGAIVVPSGDLLKRNECHHVLNIVVVNLPDRLEAIGHPHAGTVQHQHRAGRDETALSSSSAAPERRGRAALAMFARVG